jgi:probable rRNA maturation factor
MILLDPDLDPDPRPLTKSGPPSPESRKAERDARLPSSRTLNTFLREAQASVRLKGAVSVLLTTDKKIKTLNRDFRRKNKATDVLSFPADPIPGIRSREQPAGDLAISIDTARNQAAGQGHALGTEIKVLILHGLLHLAGYDHETDTGQMARRERTLRAQLKLPLGLIERTAQAPGVAPVSRPAVARVSKPAPSKPAKRRQP